MNPSLRRFVFVPAVLAAFLVAVLAGGCALPIRHTEPAVALPASWSEATARGADVVALEAEWWRRFDAEELPRLIDEAFAGSPDLAVAAERVLQAEIAMRNAGASLFPSVNLDVATSVGRSFSSGSGSSRPESSNLSLGVSYEIDIWGSNYASREAARAQFRASSHDYEAARLSLAAGVVNAYAQVLASRARLAIARENLAIAERLFKIVEARYRHGAVSALDVSRQRSTVLSQRDAILPLEVQTRESLRALALLLGRLPDGLEIGLAGLDRLAIPEPDPELPSELLLRRPDLAAAEARLAAADANVVVARAALFPLKLSLGASAGLASGEFGLLGLANPSNAANLTLSLMQAVFDGGRLRGQVEISESQRRQLLEGYRSTVLTALKEVEDALAAVERSRVQERTQLAIRAENERALRLSELRYREGSDDLSSLLDAQRSLFQVQDQLVQIRQSRLSAAVDLYKALGGGWRNGSEGV